MMEPQLVSVVIPSHNASGTLDETLRSVRSQTHRALDIIVVNDGSTDSTRDVAMRHARVDPRVRIIDQDNAGLAATRNKGWKSAHSDLIAFVDADDLWAPTKIERQLEAMKRLGDRVALVYCWYARIDRNSTVEALWEGVRFEGDVLENILGGNFIGNGSSALIRRDALIEANGFELALREAGAEGCEDWLAYCRIAERYHFAVVPEHLIGYRFHPQNMSSNRPRMLRSWMMVHDMMLARQPQHFAALRRSVRVYAAWLVQNAIAARAFAQLPTVISLVSPSIPLRRSAAVTG
jgi:glycosyltransferase involved in cell wall biosynthesis